MDLGEAIRRAASMPVAYVLLSEDGIYRYKGSCRDLMKRMADHCAGRVSRTRKRRPLQLLHVEYFDDYASARKRDLYFEAGAGRDWLKRRYP
jgi:predicted GIY-YIG superfamily endonuclease